MVIIIYFFYYLQTLEKKFKFQKNNINMDHLPLIGFLHSS